MYPNFYYIFKDWFGLEIGFLRVINTFGFFVALAFLVANYVMVLELKRKEKENLVFVSTREKWIGKGPVWLEVLLNGFFGFLFGWKILALIFYPELIGGNPQQFIFSTEGSLVLGLITAFLFGAYKYWEGNKSKLKEPKKTIEKIRPYQLMGNITILAAISGLIGAKLFHILEYWQDFLQDPLGMIFSGGGLTFYGGLIFGAVSVLIYASKRGIKPVHLLDAGSPALMLAYGVGRMGCHTSGDGDWGIVNTQDKPDWLSWLPDNLWSYNYPNNVLKKCNPYQGEEYFQHICDFSETPYLIAPVYPTALYEVLMAIGIFAFLWFIRKKINTAGIIFFIYLFFNGLERFLIEKIRVNSTYDLLGMKITQAEIISFGLMLTALGGVLSLMLRRSKKSST